VVYLYDPASQRGDVAERLISAAKAANLELQPVALRDPNNLELAFAEFRSGTNGLVLDRATPLQLRQDQICRFALQRRLPTAGFGRTLPDAGCLFYYGEDTDDMLRRAALFVDKIVKGAKPADLPVELATKYDLIINLKTAKALGLTIPQSLLQRADRVIQ
jgi:putative ABC transport system substrate-binding protein